MLAKLGIGKPAGSAPVIAEPMRIKKFSEELTRVTTVKRRNGGIGKYDIHAVIQAMTTLDLNDVKNTYGIQKVLDVDVEDIVRAFIRAIKNKYPNGEQTVGLIPNIAKVANDPKNARFKSILEAYQPATATVSFNNESKYTGPLPLIGNNDEFGLIDSLGRNVRAYGDGKTAADDDLKERLHRNLAAVGDVISGYGNNNITSQFLKFRDGSVLKLLFERADALKQDIPQYELRSIIKSKPKGYPVDFIAMIENYIYDMDALKRSPESGGAVPADNPATAAAERAAPIGLSRMVSQAGPPMGSTQPAVNTSGSQANMDRFLAESAAGTGIAAQVPSQPQAATNASKSGRCFNNAKSRPELLIKAILKHIDTSINEGRADIAKFKARPVTSKDETLREIEDALRNVSKLFSIPTITCILKLSDPTTFEDSVVTKMEELREVHDELKQYGEELQKLTVPQGSTGSQAATVATQVRNQPAGVNLSAAGTGITTVSGATTPVIPPPTPAAEDDDVDFQNLSNELYSILEEINRGKTIDTVYTEANVKQGEAGTLKAVLNSVANIPPGWQVKVSKSKERLYYEKGGKSTWVMPEPVKASVGGRRTRRRHPHTHKKHNHRKGTHKGRNRKATRARRRV
jgi:hypothetical protein